jgi:NAD(P)-dependent dehydrogenase (short-subunit alcohol dehydrogenase family)
MEFENKIAVITGASSGIGKATMHKLLEKDAVVYNLDLFNEDSNDEFYINCDVSDYNSVKESVKKIYNKHGRIDLLFANAGIHKVGNIEETSINDFEKVLSVNLKGVFYVLKEILPIMKAQGKGNIVLMGSDQSIVGKGKSAVYGLTKGAIGQLTKSTAIDYAEYNIRVNCVCPGTIETPLLNNAVDGFSSMTNIDKGAILESLKNAQPINRIAQPYEIANVVCFLLSDDSSFMTGSLCSVDGGYTCQ